MLSILEVNLQASMWPILFVLLLPYLVHYSLMYYKEKDNKIFKLVFVVLIMILVGFLNSYGIDAMTYSLKSYGISDINKVIWEMRGLSLNTDIPYVREFGYLVLIVFMVINYFYITSHKKKELYRILLLFGTLYMSILNIRNIPLFLICSLPFCCDYIPIKIKCYEDFTRKYKIIYLLLFITFIGTIFVNKDKYVLSDTVTGQKEALEFLNKKADKKNPLYTSNINGSYFNYYGYKTYIDTRAELFIKKVNKKEDIFHEYYLITYGIINYKEFLDKYKFEYVVVSDKDLLNRYLKKHQDYYKKVFSKKTILIYKRR